MNQNLSRPADSRLKPTSPATAFCTDLMLDTRWVAGNLNGVPQPRMEDELDFGILPEPYHAAARGATYAVFHFETPILWRNAKGVWQVPDHFFSVTTNKLRNKIVEALGLNGETVESIWTTQGKGKHMGINDAMETDETRLPDNELQAKADSFDRVYDYTRDRSEKNEDKKWRTRSLWEPAFTPATTCGRAVPGGMGEAKEVKGPFRGTLYEYRVAVGRDGQRAPYESWRPEWAVREALPLDYYGEPGKETGNE